jgi:uncharacterized RDD family membrane protein YckC
MSETPEETPEYGGFWIRLWASMIDTAAIVFIVGPLVRAIYGPDYFRSPQLLAGPADFLLQWVLPAVAVVAFWIYKSATPGKMITHLRIQDANTGAPPTPRQSIVRYFGYYVSMLPFFLGFLMVAFDPRKQGLHDKIAGTVVVRVRPDDARA